MFYGRAITQAVCRRLLAVEARLRSQGSPYWTVGGQSCSGTGLSPISFSPVSSIPPMLHIYSCIIWGVDNGTVSDRSSTET
jgi:hypothetical protein